MLTSHDDESLPLQKANHGEIVETAAGEWCLAHLASRPLLCAQDVGGAGTPADFDYFEMTAAPGALTPPR